MHDFSECRWETRSVQSVFSDIQRGKRLKNGDHVSGDTPYVASTSVRNGVDDFIGNTDGVRVFRDCLTLANSGSVGTTFYHPYSFVASDHVTKLSSKGMNKYVYLFLSVLVGKVAGKYGFNREINDERIKREKICIPVTKEGKPDVAFMEAYMRSIEVKLLERYAIEDLKGQKNGKGLSDLASVKWGNFSVAELFCIESGKRLESYNMKEGERPFVGASDSNNGITGFLSNDNSSKDRNVLGVNYNGSVGEAFYHPYEALFSDDVKRFHLKEIPDDKYVFLFLKVALLQQKSKFAYGYKFNAERMARQRLVLPKAADSRPDYAFMRQYMKNLEARIRRRYAEARLASSPC